MSTYNNHIKAIERLHNESLSQYVELNQLHLYVKNICDKFDERWMNLKIYETNPWTYSKPSIIFGVNERINLTKLISPNSTDSFEEKYHIPPLCEHLLLTCIDQLGQPSEWLTFNHWIKAKSKSEERRQIIEKINVTSQLDFASILYENYQEIYGVKNSFFNFFNNLLKPEQTSTLFSQIKLEIYENYPENYTFKLADTKTTIKYLYSLRNNFTHKTRSTGPYTLLWPEHKDKAGWYSKEEIHGKPILQKVFVREEYYKELENIVKLGIWEFIKQNQRE